jgi:subtilisin family serine protease
MPIKFLGASGGGSLEGAINAINYATRMGVQVMSNSWGGGGFSQTLRDAIQASSEAGIVFVAAAGNSYADNDSRPSYPASYDIPNVISVAATDNRDRKADFSNFGRRSVHVAAPGKDVVSTVRNAGYASYSGTSMACPHVAGIAALMLSRNPNMGFAELKERLIKTSTPVSALKRQVLAKGRVNAYNAVFNVIPPSDEPDDSLWVPMEYTLESSHPLADNLDQVFEVAAPGARYMRVVFERIETEERYDTVAIESASGEAVDIYSGTFQNLTSEYVAGSSLRIRVRTDGSVPSWGFKVARLEVIR